MRKQGNKYVAPIGWGDISTLISMPGPPYTQGTMVANSTMINKFSKVKPVIHADWGILNLDDFKSTNWGFGTNGIPSYANWTALQAALADITPGGVWQYQKPTGTNWYRSHDFDGYVKLEDSWGGMGVHNNVNLLFPFNGGVTIPDTTVGPFDVLKNANMDAVAADADDDGLLYLGDFAAMAAINPSYYNYANWYFGMLLVKTDRSVAYLVNTTETIQQSINNDSYPDLSGIPFQVGTGGTSVPSGDYYLYPVINSLCVSQLRNFVQISSGWGSDSQGPGRMVLLDGYRLPLSVDSTRVGLRLEYSVSVSGGRTTISIRFANNTSLDATIANTQNPDEQPFIYVTAEAVFDGDYADWEAVTDAVREWKDDGTKYTSGIYNGTRNVAAYINVYSAFYAANGNSNILRAGTHADFNIVIDSATDPLGNPYNGYTYIDLCFKSNINGVVKYQSL